MSVTMPSEAVVVRPPETAPNRMASSSLNRYLPAYIDRTSGIVVTTTPQRNRAIPRFCRPARKPGPDDMPTMAMKTLRPTEFMNQTVGEGIRPKVGFTDLNQPKTMPAINAPPEVDSVSGT